MNQSRWLPKRKITPNSKSTSLLTASIAVILSVVLLTTFSLNKLEYALNHADNGTDMLAYVSNEDNLVLYNPRSRTEEVILEDIKTFLMSPDGDLAYSTLNEDDPSLYIFDAATPDAAPINLSQQFGTEVNPLAWSHDGSLVFAAYQDWNNQSLYVWDGERTINVLPDEMLDTAKRFYVDWSNDGRLAFTVVYGWSNLDIPDEIYVWDGNETTNLSQNPNGSDGGAIWNDNGQLMFVSYRGDESIIFVWDGRSFVGKSPDATAFIHVAPDLQAHFPNWTSDGYITFMVYPDADLSQSNTKEIVLWDLQREGINRQIPIASENAWSRLSDDGQVILSSHLASGIPSYYLDVENTEGEILFSTHTGEYSWSLDGYLAFCSWGEDRTWTLSIWHGEETWEVARTSYKPVQWQNGGHTFSCNNG